jgi:hypothetical protein
MSNAENTIPLSSAPSRKQAARRKKQRLERGLLIATVAVVLAAWVYGYLTNGTDIAPLVPDVLPGTSRVEKQGDLFLGYDGAGNLLGYAGTGEGSGYAGPILVLVGVSAEGEITGVVIAEQRESPGFFRLITSQNFVSQYVGLFAGHPLKLDDDIDAVTGATTSAEGIAISVRDAVRSISAQGMSQPLPAESRAVKFGWPEASIILLYALGYVGHKLRSSAWKKRVRWTTLIGGLVVMGFIYTIPFTITMVVSLISGYWPDWHTSLYWYLLIGGILFVTTVDAKNPYCSWFCPFGAFQETLAQITKAKHYRPRDLDSLLTWTQRGLALVAVLLGLALRRPGVAGYEPFATLFDLRGTSIEWIFLAIIVLSSLLMYRPFCNLLCPLDPIFDFISSARKWVLEAVRPWRIRRTKA